MRSFYALSFAAAFCAAMPAAKAEQVFHSQYAVTLMGLPVARASFRSTIGDGRYEIAGSLSSAGVARLIDSTEGTTSVTGRVTDAGVSPREYRLDYTSDDERQRTAISFEGGAVMATTNDPPPKPRGENWVALGEDHLVAVADPMSATLVKAASAGEVCGRTLRIYDGEMRADLALSPAQGGRTPAGYEDAATCRASFEPVAGYRTTRSAIRHLRDRSRITITFARLEGTEFYAPVEATVGTQIGPLRIVAERIETQ